jgi:glycosyltransferase involved in cell wall biosynthesis
VLFVGYPHILKGVDVLIQAFGELVDDFPDWELTILGWYPDERVISRALDGTRNIAYHRPIPAEDMPAQMAAHSILVLPSRAEAMGRVLVEAMGAGVARIGTRWGGIPTVIEDGVDGLLFERGNVSELVVCLRRLMSSEDLRLALGSAAKRRVTRDFNEEKYFENVNEFYSSIIAESAVR